MAGIIKRVDLLPGTATELPVLQEKVRTNLAEKLANDGTKNYMSCVYDVFNSKIYIAMDKEIQEQHGYDTDFFEVKTSFLNAQGELPQDLKEKIIQIIIEQGGTGEEGGVVLPDPGNPDAPEDPKFIQLKETIINSTEFETKIKEILTGADPISQEILENLIQKVIDSQKFTDKIKELVPEIILTEGIGGTEGASIDDQNVSLTTTYSSQKIVDEIAKVPEIILGTGGNTIIQGEGSTVDPTSILDDENVSKTKTFSSQKIVDSFTAQPLVSYPNVIMGGGSNVYRINNQLDDYTTTEDDYDGRTIIRGIKSDVIGADGGTVTGDQSIVITKPSDDFIGYSVAIKKAGTSTNAATLTLVTGEGVTFNPADANVLRRPGSTAVLVYVGNGEFDIFGELA